MEVHIYSIKAKSQAGNIWVKVIMTTLKAKAIRYSAKDLKNLCILLESSAEGGFGSRRKHCWCYVVSVLENTAVNLVVQERVQLEHSSHIVTVSVEATYLHFNPQHIMKETTDLTGPFGTMPQEPWHPGKEAKPDRVIQINSKKVCTHASYKTTRTWENFNKQGTKMILLSDKLWLIANYKSFVHESNSIIWNNLDLCKHFEIPYLELIKNLAINLMV